MDKRSFKENIQYWYQFNQSKIPMYIMMLGVFFFTAFLDFEVQGTEIKLLSHIAAIQKFINTTQGNLAGFYLFAMFMVSLISLANVIGFAKTQSKFHAIFMTGLTALQVFLNVSYHRVFINETMIRTDYVIDKIASFSYSILYVGSVFFVIATILAWFYVDFHYVKEKEE